MHDRGRPFRGYDSFSGAQGGQEILGGEERQAVVLAHKTYHRYTTRRKQGGAQSSNDAAKGAAHSAGSSLRRHNEAALTHDVRSLLGEWRSMIDSAQLLFVRATGNTNRRTLYGPYEGQILRSNDPRIRSIPFTTRRATQAELMRAFVELTRVKISQIDEAALAAAEEKAAAATAARRASEQERSVKDPKATAVGKVSEEEAAAVLHTSQLQSLIRRSKAPAVISYLNSNSIPSDFQFRPVDSQAHHHAPSPLHLSASINSPSVVLALLTKANADPTLKNHEEKTAFDLAGDRPTRDAFRVSRHILGEDKWNWAAAHVPSALTKVEADQREERDRKEQERLEEERRRVEMEKLKKENGSQQGRRGGTGDSAGGNKSLIGGGRTLQMSAEERREEETRGMTPEARMRLERERRARAAEERIRRMQTGNRGNA